MITALQIACIVAASLLLFEGGIRAKGSVGVVWIVPVYRAVSVSGTVALLYLAYYMQGACP